VTAVAVMMTTMMVTVFVVSMTVMSVTLIVIMPRRFFALALATVVVVAYL
jgi:hypothetical protein